MENNSSGSLSDAYFHFGFYSDSMQTSAGRKVNFLIVGIVVCIYIAVILFFNIQRIKIKNLKRIP